MRGAHFLSNIILFDKCKLVVVLKMGVFGGVCIVRILMFLSIVHLARLFTLFSKDKWMKRDNIAGYS